MRGKLKIGIQGYPGSFHDEAAKAYFGEDTEVVAFRNFDDEALALVQNELDFAVMAIENSIAGSILQNYRLIREQQLWITGEYFLRISHQLMALPGQTIDLIKEVRSHPMAINQCLNFLRKNPSMVKVVCDDTAKAAMDIREKKWENRAAIASKAAAKLYDLEVLAPSIESNKQNYTRFFILRNQPNTIPSNGFDKASIYIRVPHVRGSLYKVLGEIYDLNINLSKLQSYPVAGSIVEYFFHMDLEFEDESQLNLLIQKLQRSTLECRVLGLYRRYDLESIVQNSSKVVAYD